MEGNHLAADDVVGEAELLYRSITHSSDCFRNEGGKCEFVSTAFNDRSMQVSVDRAHLRDFNPELSKLKPTDGIVTLAAARVRAIGTVTYTRPDKSLTVHKIDIKPDPVKDHPELPDNPAHAVVVPDPAYANDRVFKRLKTALALLATEAGWTLPPT